MAEHLGLKGAVLADPDRALYRLLGLRRASLLQVYSPGTLVHYARVLRSGRKLQKPVEDTRQLGGDALAVNGEIIRRWRPSAPDDRASPRLISSAAHTFRM
ncbi:MAG: hypothetical protein M3443_14025 [Actinomycetota bacterium]|nr:hypothetical protein [Actinomycetota bacterium]